MDPSRFLEIYNSLPDSLKKEAEGFVEFLAKKKVPQLKRPKNSERNGFGVWKGKIEMAEDFEAPLEDFKDLI